MQSRFKAVIFFLIFYALIFTSAFAEKFKHVQTQYIVARGDPAANSGNDAQTWGLWDKDPGPRGCSLKNYKQLETTGVASAKWPFDKKDWWLEEHGLIMEKPTFPLKVVTPLPLGARSKVSDNRRVWPSSPYRHKKYNRRAVSTHDLSPFVTLCYMNVCPLGSNTSSSIHGLCV